MPLERLEIACSSTRIKGALVLLVAEPAAFGFARCEPVDPLEPVTTPTTAAPAIPIAKAAATAARRKRIGTGAARTVPAEDRRPDASSTIGTGRSITSEPLLSAERPFDLRPVVVVGSGVGAGGSRWSP